MSKQLTSTQRDVNTLGIACALIDAPLKPGIDVVAGQGDRAQVTTGMINATFNLEDGSVRGGVADAIIRGTRNGR